MQKIRLVLSVFLIAFVAFGWVSYSSSAAKNVLSRKKFAEQGLSYYNEGLFQKSIEAYESAQKISYKTDTAVALVNARKSAYEDGTGTYSDYTNAYLDLCNANPSNADYWSGLLNFCLANEDYSTGITVCKAMQKVNVKIDSLNELTDKFNYYFNEKNKIYNVLAGTPSCYYSAYDGTYWRGITPDGETVHEDEETYLGGISSNLDYILVFEKDSRLIDKNGVVQAILAEHTDNMRAYGCSFIPMQQEDGTWSYYDINAKKYTLTGYADASSFQNNIAAVKNADGWHLINTEGKNVSDTVFSDIKLYDNGEFIYGGVFTAAVNGVYNLYDASGKQKTKLNAKDMDRYFGSSIAYCADNGKWGFADLEGKTVIEPQYAKASSFSNGIAGVSNGEKWAFLNSAGRVVSEYKFIYIGYNSGDNYCAVGDMYNEYFIVHFNFL